MGKSNHCSSLTKELSKAIEPKQTQNGWHSTSTLRTFASTAAAAKILGLNRNEIAHAFMNLNKIEGVDPLMRLMKGEE